MAGTLAGPAGRSIAIAYQWLGDRDQPSRAVDGPLRELRLWAALHCGALVQIPAAAIGRHPERHL